MDLAEDMYVRLSDLVRICLDQEDMVTATELKVCVAPSPSGNRKD